MTLQAFISRRVVTPQGIQPAAILVEGGTIREVMSSEQFRRETRAHGLETHDFGDTPILPGLVDSHVHINEPGRTEWDGFSTATRAAAAGGYTFLVDMPLNCLPATTTVAALEAKREAARGKCRVDWAAWGGVVKGNHNDIESLAAAGVPGFKCFLIDPGIDGFTMVDEEDLRLALPHLAKTGLPVLVHAELAGPVNAATERLADADWRHYGTYLQSRPDEAELLAIQLMTGLCRQYRFRLHIVHLATMQAFPELRAARAEGLPVSVETCPHYLHLAAEDIADGATWSKCAPPVRSRENCENLWQGLREGLIDLVATDHSPCPPDMKRMNEGSFRKAWGGISSLSVALSVMWTEASRRGFTLMDIARWMAEGPARLAGCAERKGRIAPGCDADFVVFDSDTEFTLTKERLHYRYPLSPYVGETLHGVVRATYLRGCAVFDEGKFPGEAGGREWRR
jgi:allantoinase